MVFNFSTPRPNKDLSIFSEALDIDLFILSTEGLNLFCKNLLPLTTAAEAPNNNAALAVKSKILAATGCSFLDFSIFSEAFSILSTPLSYLSNKAKVPPNTPAVTSAVFVLSERLPF